MILAQKTLSSEPNQMLSENHWKMLMRLKGKNSTNGTPNQSRR